MYDSLLLLLLMVVGIGFGTWVPHLLKGYGALQNVAVSVLLVAMGIAMRTFTDSGAAWTLWLRGTLMAISAVAGSIALAHVYRKCLHRGEPL